MLPTVGNMTHLDNMLVADLVDLLAGRLPSGWQTVACPRPKGDKAGPAGLVDVILKIRRRGAPAGRVLVEAKARLEPKDVDYLAASLRPTPTQPVLVAAPFISPRTQERLKAKGFGYADLTGNVRLS